MHAYITPTTARALDIQGHDNAKVNADCERTVSAYCTTYNPQQHQSAEVAYELMIICAMSTVKECRVRAASVFTNTVPRTRTGGTALAISKHAKSTYNQGERDN